MKRMFPQCIIFGCLLFIFIGSPLLAEVVVSSSSAVNLQNVESKVGSLGEFRGQVLMLSFVASWCGPCTQQLVVLDQLYKRYKAEGLVVLAVQVDKNSVPMDGGQDSEATFSYFDDVDGLLRVYYQVEAIPTTVLIDRRGQQRVKQEGYQADFEDNLNIAIRKLLAE